MTFKKPIQVLILKLYCRFKELMHDKEMDSCVFFCTVISSPAPSPHSLKMYACAKFVSTPSLVRSTVRGTSQLLSALCAVVLKQPETLTDGSRGILAASQPLNHLFPVVSPQTAPFQGH